MTTPNEMSKECRVCLQEKPLSEYSPSKRGPHGKHTYCKPCRSAMNNSQANLWNRANKRRRTEIQAKHDAKKAGL